jgi:anti-sigma regulatory factor (Ser/Thr protein kinase)
MTMAFEQIGSFDDNNEAIKKKETFEEAFSWESTTATVDRATLLSEEKLRALGWPEDDVASFSLAVNEAVANAVVHGNLKVNKKEGDAEFYERIKAAEEKEENKEKKVQVVFKFTKDTAVADIKDEGNFVPDEEKLANPLGPQGLLHGSGRGIGLIGMKVDNVEFFPGRIVLTKYRDDDKDGIEKRRPSSLER